MNHRPLTAVSLALAALAGAAHAVTPVGLPPPGQYQIDSETTTTSHAGPTTTESVYRIDGASGQITVTRRSSIDPANAPVQKLEGDGPNGWCVPAAGGLPPPKFAPQACPGQRSAVTPGGSTLHVECAGRIVDENWRRIDDRTWERSLRTTAGATPAAGASPQAAIDMAMAGMTPEQRAQAQAQLAQMPTAAQRAGAMAELKAALEAAANGSDPQEAALARQQLAAMGGGAAAPAGPVVVLKERWTRTAESCKAKGG